MKYELVIFDLDGTILDTLDDLTSACNKALSESGFPGRNREEVRLFVGSGIEHLIRQGVPIGTSEENIQRTLKTFKAYYAEHADDATKPYPGIPALMQKLRAAGIHIAINSNKIDSAAQSLCQKHFPGLYDMALGEQPGIPKKPSPEGTLKIMQTIGAASERTLYIGDSQIDLSTAQNAHIDCAWVSWGFRRREELEISSALTSFDNAEALCRFLLEDH